VIANDIICSAPDRYLAILAWEGTGKEPGGAVQPVERNLAAIFAADIAGYSRLISLDGVGTVARLKACRVVIDGLIATHRRRIFDFYADGR